MAQDVTIAGASYEDVPGIEVPKTGGGTSSFYDVTDTTATAADVAQGKYFYTAGGVRTEGTGSGSTVGTAHVYVMSQAVGTYTASDGTLKQSVLDPNYGMYVIDDDAILNSLIFFSGTAAILPTGGTGVTQKFKETFTRPAGGYVVYQATG